MSSMSIAAQLLARAPFRVGHKQVYLPNFSITLHRGRHLGPKHATFTVPLWFSKLDLRDYLFHAYDVRILSVRSYVKQQRVVQGKPSYVGEEYERQQVKRWHRPQSIKRMTVELESPFVWPEAPRDLEAWQVEMSESMEKQQVKGSKMMAPTGDLEVDEEHFTSLREQAKALLEGRETWRPPTTQNRGPVLSR